MITFQRLGQFLLAAALLCVLQACAETKNGPSPQAATQQPQEVPAAPSKETAAPKPVAAAVSKPVKPPASVNGDYQKTIDYFRRERRHRPHDQTLVKEYVKSLKEIKSAADRASQNEDFAYAGKTYNILLRNYPHFKDFVQDLSFDRAQLNTGVRNCKTMLYNRGFQEYRAGKLNEAIFLWQGYLTIDPHNTDIRKALNTARVQQKNLQQAK